MPLLSGILVATSYIPFPPWAMLFCFVPLWLFWLREPSLRRILLGTWLAQFLLGLIAFHWIPRTVHEFGGLPWAAGGAALALFAALAHPFFLLAGASFAALRGRLRLAPWALRALLPLLTAFWWATVPMIFPWNLGYPWLAARLPAFQLAEFTGFEGLGVLTLILNLLLLSAWEHRRERKGAVSLAGAAALLFLLNGAGWLAGSGQPPPDSTARVLAVQGNIGSVTKASAETREDVRVAVLARYFALTRRGLSAAGAPPDFMVWPETAYPEILEAETMDRGFAAVLRGFVRTHGVPLVTGARGRESPGGRITNSLLFIGRDGGFADRRYDKTRLLVFGERLPLPETFPGLRRLFPRTGDLAPGRSPGTRRLPGLRIGPQICYEGLFPDHSRSLAGQGAQILVNVTNDSWFGSSAEPYQHLYMTMARAIEFRLPIVRATNTGITAAMLADGTSLSASPQGAEWSHLYEIPFRKNPEPTFYQAFGDRLAAALLLAIGAVLAAGRRAPFPTTTSGA